MLYSRTILTFSVCGWVEYMQGISSRCTSISALAFAAGSPAGRASPPHFVPLCICGSFPLSDHETSPCGCGGAEIETRTTARTYSSSDHHATPVWLIFLGLQEDKRKRDKSVFANELLKYLNLNGSIETRIENWHAQNSYRTSIQFGTYWKYILIHGMIPHILYKYIQNMPIHFHFILQIGNKEISHVHWYVLKNV